MWDVRATGYNFCFELYQAIDHFIPITTGHEWVVKGAVIIYGRGWHRREKGWVNKILSK
jgi:hypothetical protein